MSIPYTSNSENICIFTESFKYEQIYLVRFLPVCNSVDDSNGNNYSVYRNKGDNPESAERRHLEYQMVASLRFTDTFLTAWMYVRV